MSSMGTNDAFRRYLDAGAALTQLTKARAEELVQELVKNGAIQGKEAQAKVDELIERSRKSSEAVLSLVREEVSSQLSSFGIGSLEDLARQVAALLGRSSGKSPGHSASTTATAPAKKAAAKRAPTKKAAGKKAAAAKKAPAKKTAAKKTATKKTAAKRAPTKKAVGKKAAAKTSTTTPPSTTGSAD
jgi:polyhydroxyalkanoate synthesis regulator phasin